MTMHWYSSIILLIVSVTFVESACPITQKYFISCGASQSLSNAIQTCHRYGMTLLNLTNSSTITADIAQLNNTLMSVNCNSNFWFASRNTTGYVGSVTTLGSILGSLLGGLGLLLGALLDSLSCLIIFCPFTTTPPPITSAMIVCVRPIQQRVIQKCQIASTQSNMRAFQFQEQPMYGGILDSFPSSSRTACSGQCSNNNDCVGISYINGICNLYI